MISILKKIRIPIHVRIFLFGAGIFTFFLTASFVYQYTRELNLRKEILHQKLQSYNYIIAQSLTSSKPKNKHLDFLAEKLSEDRLRITLIDKTGTVLYDNIKRYDTFDNHASRPEFIDALKNGAGYALRGSESIGTSFFYSARKHGDIIIRSALPFNMNTSSYLKVDTNIFLIFVVMTLATILIILLFSIRLGKTIASLRSFALKAEQEELDALDMHFPVNDIGTIANHIIHLYKQLSKAKKDLVVEKEKLIKHLQIAKEGLCVFTPDRKAIFTNTLFIQYINIVSDTELSSAEGIFNIPEFERIKYFISLNAQRNDISTNEYLSEHIIISKNGKTFDVECIIFQDMSFEVTINNITQLEQENRVKRQLTQNVAHELKTPVSSIKGYLETIIENPEIDAKMMLDFIERCHAQANRLSGLLKDISVLNRLDEAGDLFEAEEINIHELVHDIVDESNKALALKQMQVQLQIDDLTCIQGNPLLVYSIFRNLLDNAIAYAGDGKQVVIKCYHQDDNSYYFSFSDNGSGIPEKHLNRIFERFYRVDKGRSRKAGGTGLGLAIVKNAVLFHKGEISAKKSHAGGIEFLFSLQKVRD